MLFIAPAVWLPSLALAGASVTIQADPTTPRPDGTELCVASHRVNLRKGPSTRSGVADRLELGTRVLIRAVVPGGPQRIGARTDYWYEVVPLDAEGVAGDRGFMYGGTLTGACWSLDLDGDGTKEPITASITPDGVVLVQTHRSSGVDKRPLPAVPGAPAAQLTAHTDGLHQAVIQVSPAADSGTVRYLTATTSGLTEVHRHPHRAATEVRAADRHTLVVVTQGAPGAAPTTTKVPLPAR